MKLFDEMPYLENEYVILKEMSIVDAPHLQVMTADPEVYEYLPTTLYEKKYEDLNIAIARMRRECFDSRESIILGIYPKSDPTILVGIGEIYAYDEMEEKASIGYRLAQKYWGRGIALQTATLLKYYLVETIRIRTITAHVMTENAVSGEILEMIGFEKRFSGLWEDWGREKPVLTNKFVYDNPDAG